MSQTTINFADIQAKIPTTEAVTVEYAEIDAALDQAQDTEAKKLALQKWEDCNFSKSQGSLAAKS